MTRAAQLELNLFIQPPYRREVDEDWLRKVVSQALERHQLPGPTEVGVVITGDEVVADLNQRYRGVHSTTDVLSFSLDREDGLRDSFVNPPDGFHNLGEVVVSYPQAIKQAEEHGHKVEEELAFLTVHGLLHLLGYDHENEQEAKAMREQETQALAGLGIERRKLG